MYFNHYTQRLLLLCMALSSFSIVNAEEMPEFSWDTVPLYMHVRKTEAFTPKEIKYLSGFPLITLEKTTGMGTYGSSEKGTLKAAEAIKQINPKSKVLYYRNILVHYDYYDADQKLTDMPSPFLANKEGKVKLVRNKTSAYDLSNPLLQEWWLENAREVCASPYIDGLFIDGNIKALEPKYLKNDLGEDKKTEVEKGYHDIMKKLPATIGEEEIILANIIRARFERGGLEYLDYFDGSYTEQFEENVGGMSREEYMAKGIASVQSAARSGKIIAFTMGMGKSIKTELGIDESRAKLKNIEEIRNRFDYSLALFLICAEKYSYFMAYDGYGVDNGESMMWMRDIPKYSYPLGAPKGPATQDGFTYQREFEHASVSLDLVSERGVIDWKKK